MFGTSGFINWAILGDPINWLIVVFVLLFVSYSVFVVTNNAGALLPKI
jgi:hypothetical protein